MARVSGGTFKVENNMLVFEAEENSAGIDEFNSQRTQKFKEAADLLNNQVRYVEGEFVGVCDSKERVFVAVNFPSIPSMSAEVFEISVQKPVKFLNLIDEQNLINDNRVNGSFKRGTKILKICSSGKENAAILVEESQKKYVLLRVSTFQGEDTSYDFEGQWGKKWEMFSRTWYEYPIITDGEEKMVVDIKCDQDSCIALTDDGKKFECMFNSSFGVIDDGNQIKYTHKQVGHHSEWILKTNCGMLTTDITSDLPPCSGKARNTDLQMEYKRDLVVMSNKSGVTGYGNQYLVDITTDGIMSKKLQDKVDEKNNELLQMLHTQNEERSKQYKKAHAKLLEKIRNEKEEMIKQHAVNVLAQTLKKAKLNQLVQECEVIEGHLKTVQDHLTSVEDEKMQASENLNIAQRALEEATTKYNKINEEYCMLSRQFKEKEAQIEAGGKITSDNTSSSSSMDSKNRSVQLNNKPDQSGKRKSWFGGLFGLKAENELDLENIAHFSAPRENRCAYV